MLFRAFHASITLAAATCIQVQGEGLSFTMTASSDLQGISRRVKEELVRSVFSLQIGGRYLFTDNQLQRRVTSAPASELTVAVELCGVLDAQELLRALE
jgi:hypothetical protein